MKITRKTFFGTLAAGAVGLVARAFGQYPSTGCPPPVHRWHQLPEPTLAHEMDVLLTVYHSDDLPDAEVRRVSRLANSIGCKRVVTYPDGYVPVLVPKEEVDAVIKLLGPERCVRVSPALE